MTYQKYRKTEDIKAMAGAAIFFFFLGWCLMASAAYVDVSGRNAEWVEVREQEEAEEMTIKRRGRHAN